MTFAKANDLLRLAQLAASRRLGISLEEISQEFGISHRTAQRMTSALEDNFANVVVVEDDDRRRRWRIESPMLDRLQPRQENTIEALEIAARAARDENRLRHARALEDLRDSLITRLSPRDALRSEADAEAVLSALGQVARPGPKVAMKPEVTDVLIEALRGPFKMRIVYGETDAETRTVEPHGLLLGLRSYLVARQADRGENLRHFRLDRIHSAECLDESFPIQSGFSLNDHAAQAFGAYQDPAQYGEIVWRFLPEAASRAAEFQFHPNQSAKYRDDGSLIVRFKAAGWLEMAWHLYQWGDKVEVLEPAGLRALVEGHARPDFPALP
ncbi:MAG: WYL domain-containing protein [Alphaproteobacteria bacterium]|nr:WYL domain-containing protein [Alphaproteobacteria bacterium]MBU0831045.1 WYL domain-containing protein [Alphaproteobacteria bacterium]MBU1768783.1 WYL domain-containing protein [Alphaproteobacteria bacterium]